MKEKKYSPRTKKEEKKRQYNIRLKQNSPSPAQANVGATSLSRPALYAIAVLRIKQCALNIFFNNFFFLPKKQRR